MKDWDYHYKEAERLLEYSKNNGSILTHEQRQTAARQATGHALLAQIKHGEQSYPIDLAPLTGDGQG